MSDSSRRYNNLKYAIDTLCKVIASCKVDRIIAERYMPQLDKLVDEIRDTKKEVAEEMANIDKQKLRWAMKLKKLEADARLDNTLSEDLRERILAELKELEQRIASHGDS